jgi:hypothetical protein
MESSIQNGALSPPEAHMLPGLARPRAREALKIAISWMLALRILHIQEREEPRWWG